MKTATHAQFKFTRRLNNKKFGQNNPDFGEPIPGELSATEKAHKQRRRDRRKVILAGRVEQARKQS